MRNNQGNFHFTFTTIQQESQQKLTVMRLKSILLLHWLIELWYWQTRIVANIIFACLMQPTLDQGMISLWLSWRCRQAHNSSRLFTTMMSVKYCLLPSVMGVRVKSSTIHFLMGPWSLVLQLSLKLNGVFYLLNLADTNNVQTAEIMTNVVGTGKCYYDEVGRVIKCLRLALLKVFD